MRGAPLQASLAALTLGACTLTAPEPSAPEPRGVLLILADDLGVETLGCYGGTSYATPNLDRLAAEGLRFTAAHTSPLCTPSRVRLLTARSAPRSYVDFSVLHPGERSLAEVFDAAGYATAAAGKWQLLAAEHYGERAGSGTHPRDAGFDTWCLWQVAELGSRYWNPRIERDGSVAEHPGEYGPDRFTDYLLDFLARHRDEPFFAFYPMVLPHGPFESPPGGTGADRQARFGEMVMHMDALVGRLLDGLEELGLRESTLVVFASDNGSPRPMVSRVGENTVSGGKGLTRDAGTHVPLLVSWPGVVPAGRSLGGLVDLMDVGPTVLDSVGLAFPDDRPIDGRSFWDTACRGAGPLRDVWTCEYDPRPGNPGFPPARWARGPRYKLYGDGRFFDVMLDPEEQAVLDPALESAEVRAEHRRLTAALGTIPALERLRPTGAAAPPR